MPYEGSHESAIGLTTGLTDREQFMVHEQQMLQEEIQFRIATHPPSFVVMHLIFREQSTVLNSMGNFNGSNVL